MRLFSIDRTLGPAVLALALALSFVRTAAADDPSALPALPPPSTPSTDPMPDLVAPPPAKVPPPEPAPPSAPTPYKSTNEHPDDLASESHNPVFRASVGYDWRSYYGVPFRGVDFGLGIGGERGHLSAYGELGLTLESTRASLSSRKVRAGGGVEYVEGRLRLGLGVYFAYVNIDRITIPNDNFEFATWGIFGTASFDLVRLGAVGGLYVQAKFGGDIFVGGGDEGTGTSWGPTFSAGLRY